MSRIDELIERLCPDGVEYRELRDVCDEIIVPMRDRPKDLSGSIPWCRIEDIEGFYFHASKAGLGVDEKTVKEMNLKVFPEGTVICSCSASIGSYAINTQPLITNQTFIGLVCGSALLNTYLRFYMETQTSQLIKMASTGTIPYISRKKFESLAVPIPPMEVQEEIVRVLDSFAELEAELEAVLEAELEARRKQYTFYRDQLLTFPEDKVEWTTLGDLFDFKNGLNKGKEYFGHGQPIVNFTDVFNKNKLTTNELTGRVEVTDSEKERYSALRGDVFFTRTSETKEEVGMSAVLLEDIPGCVFSGFVLRARPKTNALLSDYCAYCMSAAYIRKQIYMSSSFTTRALTSGTALSKVRIPVPSISEQRRIVDILDKFDALTNDISAGLPAEIDARRKQYEYYRDKLLTFKELEAS